MVLPAAALAEETAEPLPENVEMEGFAGDDEEDVGEIYDEDDKAPAGGDEA